MKIGGNMEEVEGALNFENSTFEETTNGYVAKKFMIKRIDKEYDEETKDKKRWALISGMYISGVLAPVLLSNAEFVEAAQTEIETLNSFESLGRYLSVTTPEMWSLISSSIQNFLDFSKNNYL